MKYKRILKEKASTVKVILLSYFLHFFLIKFRREDFSCLFFSSSIPDKSVIGGGDENCNRLLNSLGYGHSSPVGGVLRREPLLTHAPKPASVIDPAAGQMQRPPAMFVVDRIHRYH